MMNEEIIFIWRKGRREQTRNVFVTCAGFLIQCMFTDILLNNAQQGVDDRNRFLYYYYYYYRGRLLRAVQNLDVLTFG